MRNFSLPATEGELHVTAASCRSNGIRTAAFATVTEKIGF
jgi:hypothetical protein